MTRQLSIGGVRFEVQPAGDVHVLPPDLAHRPFLGLGFEAPGVEEVVVRVRVVPGEPTPCGACPVVFDTGQSWFAQRDGDDLVLLHRGPGADGRLLWSARLSADRSRVQVVCGELLWSRRPQRTLEDPLVYPLDQLLTMLVLARRQEGVIVHAAGVIRGDRAVACAGVSGAGKSTLVELLDDDLTAVSDDRVVVRRSAGGAALFGTPWPGEAKVARPDVGRLVGLVLLHKADTVRLEPVSRSAALRQLLPTLSVPWFDARAAADVLALTGHLLESVPAYELHFPPDTSVRRALRELLR